MFKPDPTSDSKTHVRKFLFEFCYFEVIFVIKDWSLSYLIFYKCVDPLERVDPTIWQKTGDPLM